jgi:Spy/CpxP family protein refolding chaperone
MIRSIAFGLLLALATTSLGTFSSHARAAGPADGQAKHPRRTSANANGHLWWNDPSVVEKLSLSDDQRAQMDGLLETNNNQRKTQLGLAKLRGEFNEALKQGDVDQARKGLASWAEEQKAVIQALGELKIGVIPLLSPEQRKALSSAAYPQLIQTPWTPKARWGARPQRERPVQKHPKPAG